jgi:hypothetical protein
MPRANNIFASKNTLLVEEVQTLRQKNRVQGFHLARRQAFRSGVVSLFRFGAQPPVQVAKGTGQRNAGPGRVQYRTSSKP